MASVLIQFAHPAFSRSRVQKALVKACRNLEGVTFNDLYEQYPDLYIDIRREKELLLQHDVIILQHPFYWYSGPAIIKQWQDLVLEYNWAYGPSGYALQGKKLISAISCGNTADAYDENGMHGFPLKQFLLPFQRTAHLCRMEYLSPFVVFGAHRKTQQEIDAEADVYAKLIAGFVADRFTGKQCHTVEYLNQLLSTP
ncbi:NAD(P)H-dependent oxidoreductase [Sediminibacterium ginsengisoli]|uniref:Kef-type potassium/proton antiporter accessory protein, CPA2 family n=1 Tax=Sediminibacterium ginsengisoli TaxID=413434 RepID=A0A1T4RL38_9BACT|nr:NAD(P)H-dependent oxidoreductase [Sediminibacterium ginsengisoli]SKA16695.1 Kef-type potassium/proton antiporter accessory protein, CPA2 family [Sediminibacterium ginsengisoli]